MNCFLFPGEKPVFENICGNHHLQLLVSHLQRCGVKRIFSSVYSGASVERADITEAMPLLGQNWLAVYGGMVTEQDPRDLAAAGRGNVASLACSGKPWNHTEVLTDGYGTIVSFRKNPPPENTRTNMCFSGMVLVRCSSFDPVEPLKEASAELLDGYWRRPFNREEFLLLCHDLLSGTAGHGLNTGPVMAGSPIPKDCTVSGTLWLGKNCIVHENCSLENCVIMDKAEIGRGSKLKNCLVGPECSVKPRTEFTDKYLTLLGD